MWGYNHPTITKILLLLEFKVEFNLIFNWLHHFLMKYTAGDK